jgi:hypothetical protein
VASEAQEIVPVHHIELHLIRNGEWDCVGDKANLGGWKEIHCEIVSEILNGRALDRVCYVVQKCPLIHLKI